MKKSVIAMMVLSLVLMMQQAQAGILKKIIFIGALAVATHAVAKQVKKNKTAKTQQNHFPQKFK
jgi:hypothetical protein